MYFASTIYAPNFPNLNTYSDVIASKSFNILNAEVFLRARNFISEQLYLLNEKSTVKSSF